jgi:CheY-like chemotaxis protein
MTTTQKTILYIEDDEDDRYFFMDIMRKTHPELTIVHAENGQAALDYLTTRKEDNLPHLVILDINMPKVDGKEFLSRITNDEVLKSLNIVVFTSSENPYDKQLINRMGICLVNKPYNIALMPGIIEDLLTHSS